MPVAAEAGEASRSASSIVADAARGHHILKIEGYSLTTATPTGESIKYRPFTIGGHRWCIRYFPNGYNSESSEYVSLFLTLDEIVAKVVKAPFRICFVDKAGKQALKLDTARPFASNGSWGYRKFIKREHLEKSVHLKDDSFAVRCDILVIKDFRAVEKADQVGTQAFVSVPPSDLHQDLGGLLLSGKGADVVFQVGGETFAAHRCVLAALSPVFCAELFGAMKESDAAGVVRIHDMEAQVFQALLHFVYTDSLPKTTKKRKRRMSMFQHLLVAADRYNLERLKLMCEEELCGYIDVSTVATILMLAEQHRSLGLKKACFAFLGSSTNLKAVMATDGFDHLNKSCPSLIMELVAMLGT